jgi:hypothetical protein
MKNNYYEEHLKRIDKHIKILEKTNQQRDRADIFLFVGLFMMFLIALVVST